MRRVVKFLFEPWCSVVGLAAAIIVWRLVDAGQFSDVAGLGIFVVVQLVCSAIYNLTITKEPS